MNEQENNKLSEKLKKLLNQLRECASEVYGILGAGYEEKVYEEAMAIEMRKRGIGYEYERNIEVLYRGEKVGVQRTDFIVLSEENELIIIELKAHSPKWMTEKAIAQLCSYLRTTKVRWGFLVNFRYPQQFTPDFALINQFGLIGKIELGDEQ